MSKKAAMITQGIQHLGGKGYEIHSGVVQSVDEASGTMTVLLTPDEANTENVILGSVAGNVNGLMLIPQVGSDVIIGNIDGGGEDTLLKASSITKAIITIGTTKITIDANGYSITHNGESLTSILTDLLSALQAMTFTNGGGTTPPANNIGTINTIKSRISNLLT